MPSPTPDHRDREPRREVVSINIRLTEADTVMGFHAGVAALYRRMAVGEVTLDAAVDELGRLLARYQGETL